MMNPEAEFDLEALPLEDHPKVLGEVLDSLEEELDAVAIGVQVKRNRGNQNTQENRNDHGSPAS